MATTTTKAATVAMNIQRPILAVLSSIIVAGTAYSVLYDTYLDTSNPLLTHLPHPLADSHYFASKKNWLNVVFIKKAWGWTSGAFLLSWFTSPLKVSSRPSARLLLTYFTLTALWVLFTSWFFGPALLERVVLMSGGECVIPGPSNIPLTVPHEYCFTRSTISAQTHPELFQSFFAPADASTPSDAKITISCPPYEPECIEQIRGVPRLRKGHDVSGHLFLLTMGVMLLAKQLEASLMSRTGKGWSTLHRVSVALNVGLLALWLFASATTSVYFHSPWEKITGFLLGLAGYSISQVAVSLVLPRQKATSRTLKTQ